MPRKASFKTQRIAAGSNFERHVAVTEAAVLAFEFQRFWACVRPSSLRSANPQAA